MHEPEICRGTGGSGGARIRQAVCSILPFVLVVMAFTPGGTVAQDFIGQVVDARSGEPIPNVLVRVVGPAFVTLTDAQGRFSFQRIDERADSVVMSRLGYRTLRTFVEFNGARSEPFELEIDPIELEGIATEITFETLMNRLESSLDSRLGEWPGSAKSAGPEILRRYDEEWSENPWGFLHHGPLKASWVFNGAPLNAPREDQLWVQGFGKVTPEVYLNDQRIWLQRLIETPNESLCRFESYMPARFQGGVAQPPPMIRAYSCDFMARVAFGLEEVCHRLQWGRVISGPGSLSAPSIRAEEQRSNRDRGNPELGGTASDPVFDSNAIGVGSAAC